MKPSDFRAAAGFRLRFSLALLWLAALPVWAAPGRQQLRDHLPEAVARLTPVGRLPADQTLRLAIGLPLRRQDVLKGLLRDLYDPASPRYRRYLTPAQFAAQFGPTEADYQKVAEFAQANGLRVTGVFTNRVILDVEGAAADIERAFHVSLFEYRHPVEDRRFFAPDTEPSLDLDVPINHIDGLHNYWLPTAAYASGEGVFGSGPPTLNDEFGTYGGSDLRNAYCTAPFLGDTILNEGGGQSVGLLQFADYYDADIAAYETQFGITGPTVNRVIVGAGSGTNFSLECSLDIEMVISMAPHCTVQVYEGSDASSILAKMAESTQCSQFSCSWTWGGTNEAHPNEEALLVQMQAQGQSFFTASGDADSLPDGAPYPSDSPNLTSVGGTVLYMSFFGEFWQSEEVWNTGSYSDKNKRYTGGSGGVSARYSTPSWQQGVSMAANGGSITMRNYPDVAAVAQDLWIAYGNGRSEDIGGTSAAAPIWAGYMALANQEAASIGKGKIGFVNPALYTIGTGAGLDTYADCFNDITTGDNESPLSPSGFVAVPGYDLCTGWGTPTYTLVKVLAGSANVSWVDLTVTDLEDPFPIGTKEAPYWYLVDHFVVDAGGALARVSATGANIVFEHAGSGTSTTESSSLVGGTGISRIAQPVRISAVPGLTIKLEP